MTTVADGGLTLTRHGVCPFNGDLLYVSREGEAAINSMSETGERVTLWVAAGRSSTEEIHIPAGLYPLAEKSARLEVPQSTAIIRTTPAVLSRRLEAPRKEADNWHAYTGGEAVLARRLPQKGGSRSRSGKTTWDCGYNKILHYPTLEFLGSNPMVLTDHVETSLFVKGPHFLQYLRISPAPQ